MLKKMRLLFIILISFTSTIYASTWSNIIIDHYVNANVALNSLNGYCEAYSDQGVFWLGEGAGWGYNGGGMVSSLSNTNSTGFYYYYLSVLSNASGGYLDLTDTYNNHSLRFYMQTDPGVTKKDRFNLEKIQLKNSANALIGEVDFANYNHGSNIVSTAWKEYSIPFTDFSGGTGNLSSVKTLIFFTSITQSAQYKLSQLCTVKGVQVSGVSLSNRTTGEQNPSICDLGDTIRIKVTERSNIFGCSGYVKLTDQSTSQETAVALQEVKNGVNSFYYADFTPSNDTRYGVEAILSNAHQKDSDGSDSGGYDAEITIGEGMSSLTVNFREGAFYQAVPGEAYMNIPKFAFQNAETVKFGIQVVNIPASGKTVYGKMYKFLPVDFQFERSVAIGLPVPASTGYSVFTYNGYEWVQIPSVFTIYENNTYLQIMSYTTGIYAVFLCNTIIEDKLKLSRRTFTPNNDGVNDEVIIYSPVEYNDVTKITVYDLNGRIAARLTKRLSWNGKNDSNRAVRSGLYVIKLETLNKAYYQTVTVFNK